MATEYTLGNWDKYKDAKLTQLPENGEIKAGQPYLSEVVFETGAYDATDDASIRQRVAKAIYELQQQISQNNPEWGIRWELLAARYEVLSVDQEKGKAQCRLRTVFQFKPMTEAAVLETVMLVAKLIALIGTAIITAWAVTKILSRALYVVDIVTESIAKGAEKAAPIIQAGVPTLAIVGIAALGLLILAAAGRRRD